MLPPQRDDAGNGGSSDRLEVSADARVERLQRRVAALERQLEARIAHIADLEVELRQKTAAYDALMATLTMRILRRPRAWYGQARRRLARRGRRRATD